MIITALYPPAVGGAATYFGGTAPELARRDEIERLTILTECIPGQPRRWTDGELRVLRCLPARASLPQRRWLVDAMTYVLTQLWFVACLPGLVRREGVNLIHFHTRYRGRLFYAALRRSVVPVIADLRDKMTDPARLVSVADQLLCCGEGVQRFAIAGGFPSERTALIPIPFTPPETISPDRVSEARRRYGVGEEPYLLFVGDITTNKGVYDLLDAYRRWQPEHPQVRLVLVGVNREGERFLDRVRRAEALFLGHVPHQDALALMHGAEIVVLPSRSEGLPRVILEAVALATRVICPPGIPEFERHLSRFVLPDVSPGAILEMLDRVWSLKGPLSYPLADHSVGRVVEGLVEVYYRVEG